MWDERKAIAVLRSVCAAELDRHSSARYPGVTSDERHMLLHGIARELESLAEVLNLELGVQPKATRWGLLRTYRRVLELPLARTVRTVLTSQRSRLERVVLERQLDAA